MEKIRLGKTNMMVSRLGFGGIPIQRASTDAAVAVVKRCLELGVTFIDTANGYTTSEEHIGKAISGRCDGLILATKSHSRSREEIEAHIQLSLKRLGVKSIDLFQFHNVSDSRALERVLDPNGPMSVVEEAKRAGLVKHIGVSSHQIDTAKEAVKSDRFETIMFPCNFIAYEPAEELITIAREHDVGFIAMKPLAGGMLENVSLAFKYIFQFPDVVPIPGIEKVHEIEEIIQVLEGPWEITESEKCEMQRLREELGTKFCRRCDYCQPCTQEIPISMVMGAKSALKRLSQQQLFNGITASAIEKATHCTECGDCEGRCPYHLPIIETLAENVRLFQEERKKYQEQLGSR